MQIRRTKTKKDFFSDSFFLKLETKLLLARKVPLPRSSANFKVSIRTYICKGRGKAILLQVLTGPDVSRRLRLPDFKTIGT
jgi:hypothetical protein